MFLLSHLDSSNCDYCGEGFTKKTYNQRYCSPECCRLSTNERIMQRYYEKRGNRRGAERYCNEKGCNTKLSRYNDDKKCSIHSGQKDISTKDLFRELGL